MSLLFRRKRLVFSDNNFQDYEFTRLNTYKKKEMSEELTIILSNNYYWNQFLEIIGNPSAGRSQLLSEKTSRLRRKEETSLYKIILCSYYLTYSNTFL